MTSGGTVIGGTVCLTVLSFITFVCHIVGFSTANWLESRPGLSTVKSIGLHVVCFEGYEHDDDPRLAYYGCRHFTEYYLRDIVSFLVPSWFELVQLLQIISLICMGVAFFLMIGSCVCAYFRRYKRNSRFRNILLQLLLFLCAIIFTTTALLIIVSLAIFQMNAFNRDWLPRPEVNYLSFSFNIEIGSAVLAAICGIVGIVVAIFQTVYMARLKIPSMAEDMTLS